MVGQGQLPCQLHHRVRQPEAFGGEGIIVRQAHPVVPLRVHLLGNADQGGHQGIPVGLRGDVRRSLGVNLSRLGEANAEQSSGQTSVGASPGDDGGGDVHPAEQSAVDGVLVRGPRRQRVPPRHPEKQRYGHPRHLAQGDDPGVPLQDMGPLIVRLALLRMASTSAGRQ